MLVMGACLGALAISCASSVTQPATGVTSLQRSDETRSSREIPVAPAHEAESRVQGPVIDPRTSQAVEALVARDYTRVLALSEPASSAPAAAWLDYDRGAALVGLARTDDAVEAFLRAELRFGDAGDTLGRSVAIWGRARALGEVGRCADARHAFEQYAAFVRATDPRAAEMAAAYAGACRPLVSLH